MNRGVFFVIFSLVFSPSLLFAEEKNVEELLKCAASVPEAIKRGEYLIRSRYDRHAEPLKNMETTIRIVFDGEKTRIDREAGKRKTVYCSFYKNNEQVFFFESEPRHFIKRETPPGLELSPPILTKLIFEMRHSLIKTNIGGFTEDRSLINVKSMGYIPCSISYQAVLFPDLSQYLPGLCTKFSENDQIESNVTHDEYKGIPCLKITITMDNKESIIKQALKFKKKGLILSHDTSGNPTPVPSDEEIIDQIRKIDTRSQKEIIIDPAKNFALRSKKGLDKSFMQHNLENDLSQDKSTGLWYPSHWVYESYMNGKLVEREENTLEVISLNKRIDPKRFSLEGVEELKPGTPVVWKLDTPPPGKGKLEWDGKKIFAHGEFGENLVMQNVDPAQPRKRMIFIVSVNVVVIAGIVVFQYYRAWRRRNPEA